MKKSNLAMVAAGLIASGVTLGYGIYDSYKPPIVIQPAAVHSTTETNTISSSITGTSSLTTRTSSLTTGSQPADYCDYYKKLLSDADRLVLRACQYPLVFPDRCKLGIKFFNNARKRYGSECGLDSIESSSDYPDGSINSKVEDSLQPAFERNLQLPPELDQKSPSERNQQQLFFREQNLP